MSSEHIGVIYCKKKKVIKAVFNPEFEDVLDDPNLVRNTEEGEDLCLLKINRTHSLFGVCPDVMSPRDCVIAIEIAKQKLGW